MCTCDYLIGRRREREHFTVMWKKLNLCVETVFDVALILNPNVNQIYSHPVLLLLHKLAENVSL